MTTQNENPISINRPDEPAMLVVNTTQQGEFGLSGEATTSTPTGVLPEYAAPMRESGAPAVGVEKPVHTASANRQPDAKLKKAIAAVATLALGVGVAVGINANRSNQSQDTAPVTPEQPVASAAPSTTFQETTLPPSTIVVPAKPAAPVVTAKPKPVETTATSAPSSPESNAPEQLTDNELKQIETFSGFSLEGHDLKVWGRSSGNNGRILMIGADGEKPGVTLEQINANITFAKELAAQNPTLSAQLHLGPDTDKEITYQVKLAPYNTHIFIFGKNIQELAKPQAGFAGGTTVNEVSLIENDAPGIIENGVDTFAEHVGTETIQNVVSVSLSPESAQLVEDGTLDTSFLQAFGSTTEQKQEYLRVVGQETLAITGGDSRGAKAAHMPHGAWAARAEGTSLHAYSKTGAREQPELVPASIY